MRKTKIVCTIGPACDSEETLRAMMLAGMNVARLNFSHGTHAEHQVRIDRIKKLRAELDLPIAIMLDTKDAATKSTSFSMPKSRSRLSCSLRNVCLSTLFGKLMLLRSESTPPAVTRQTTSVPVVAVTVSAMSPSLTSTVSPGSRSCARPA